MDRQALINALKEILEDNQGETFEDLNESVALREDLGLDSVDLVTLVMQVQDRFRVVLTSGELEQVVTVKDILDLMQCKMKPVPRAA